MRLSAAPRQSLAPWRAARNELHLPPGEVHLWWVGLQMEGPSLCVCWDLLSPEETQVASGYRFVKHLREFVVKRAVLRQNLARYTGQSLADFRFELKPSGKAVVQDKKRVHL